PGRRPRPPPTPTPAPPHSGGRASGTESRSPTLASSPEPSSARSTCTLPFFAVTTASEFSPAVPPVDDAATPEPDRSRLQAGTARKTARSATARRIARLYEARCQLCKFRLEDAGVRLPYRSGS